MTIERPVEFGNPQGFNGLLGEDVVVFCANYHVLLGAPLLMYEAKGWKTQHLPGATLYVHRSAIEACGLLV